MHEALLFSSQFALFPILVLGFLSTMSRSNCWNSSYGNMPRFSHVRQRPSPQSPQIACRVCDRIFMSSRALIDHLAYHMAEDESISTRQQEINLIAHQRECYVSVNQFQSNLCLLTSLQETQPSIQNSYSLVQNPTGTVGNHISTTQFDVLSPQLQLARRNYSFRPQLMPSVQQAQQRVVDQLPRIR